MDLRSRWTDAWAALCAPADRPLLDNLLGAYNEPQRDYHTLQHLEECFIQFDLLKPAVQHAAEIELALWFHDAIYDTHRDDNEARSAQWAREAITPASAQAAERVHRLVMATRHDAVPEGIDAQVVVDVDLAILGATQARFDQYERQVRAEYAWVPRAQYREERRRVLAGFLSRATVFNTADFIQRYEAQARRNLERALARL